MKRKVIIELEVDPTEYHGAHDSSMGAISLVYDMLTGEADLPRKARISCEGKTDEVDLDSD